MPTPRYTRNGPRFSTLALLWPVALNAIPCESYAWGCGTLHTNRARGLCMASMYKIGGHLRVRFSRVDFGYVCERFANHIPKGTPIMPQTGLGLTNPANPDARLKI